MKKNILLLSVFIGTMSLAQSVEINLGDKLKADQIQSINREITTGVDNSSIQMDARPGDGLGVIKDISFVEGVIDLEIKGENNPGKSFVGFAFNIQNDSTYEAVYFRPFNFVAEEEIRQAHMVQYIHHPQYTWRVLRESRTGQFENRIENPPDPDDWFRAKIVVEDKRVIVYLDERTEPSLKVERLDSHKSDKVGIWTGFNSSGEFRNLNIGEQD